MLFMDLSTLPCLIPFIDAYIEAVMREGLNLSVKLGLKEPRFSPLLAVIANCRNHTKDPTAPYPPYLDLLLSDCLPHLKLLSLLLTKSPAIRLGGLSLAQQHSIYPACVSPEAQSPSFPGWGGDREKRRKPGLEIAMTPRKLMMGRKPSG